MKLKNKRIFMLEDNVANRAITQMLLEQHGAQVAFERWGTDTVKRLHDFMPVDLIILDLMLPNQITGYEVFTKIRQQHEFDGIPIIALSASNPSEAIPLTRQYGFNGFISKPVDYDLFPRQIADILSGETIWHQG
ncbi:MAG: response regulator [Anaerolineae bacterium]|nr:response regulator [Anaerolineae bacterium]